jgi:hypothetical protein
MRHASDASAASMSPQAIELKAENERNILHLSFRGIVRGTDMEGTDLRAAELAAALRPGFVMIGDLTDLEAMDLDCVPHLTRMMELLANAGMGHVIRVIPDPDKDIGFTLLSHTHYRGRIPFQICSTRAEADVALATLLASRG